MLAVIAVVVRYGHRSRIIGCARHSVARSRGQGQYYRLRALHKHVVHRGDRDQPCLLPIGYRHASTYVRIIRYIGRIRAPVAILKFTTMALPVVFAVPRSTVNCPVVVPASVAVGSLAVMLAV